MYLVIICVNFYTGNIKLSATTYLEAGVRHGNLYFLYSTCSQDDLDKVVGVWDQHLIRPSKNERVPHGRPNIMYNLPELYGSTECRLTVSSGDLDAQEQYTYCTFRKCIPCDRDMFELSHEIMEERG